jgi:hypothetical protein
LREPCLIREALEAGATPLKPAKKSLWGYGVGQAPDGTIWTLYRPGRIRGGGHISLSQAARLT